MSREKPTLLAEHEARLRFETLIADLSTRFINLPAGEVDREITDAQRRICELLGFDFSALWQWSNEIPDFLTLTHFYCTLKDPQHLAHMREDQYPWSKEQLLAGRTITISSLEELPPEASRDRETLQQFGIKSNLAIPLSVGGELLVGILGLGTMRKERDWPEMLVQRLQLAAQIFANALARKRADLILSESIERLSLTTDSAEVGLWILDCRTRVFWASDKARSIFRYSPDEAITLERFKASVHPDDWPLVQGSLEQAMQAGHSVNVEYRIRLDDGRIRWITSRGRPAVQSCDKPQRLMGSSLDITERKNAEEALRASEARLQAGSDLAGLGYYEVHYTAQTCFLDTRFREICGVPAAVYMGLEPVTFWLEHVHSDDLQLILEERQKLHDSKIDHVAIEYRYAHPTEGVKWIHHLARMAEDNVGGVGIRTFGVIRDITETKRLSERLQSAAHEWQVTFNAINDMVIILDHEHRVVRVNAATARFLGVPAEELVGTLGCTWIHGPGCTVETCPSHQTFQTKARSESELFYSSRQKWLLLSTDPIQDATGNIIGAVHVVRDITQNKLAEAELQQQHAELAHVARVSTLGELATSVAHELNQPLGAILANAEAAELFLQQNPPALDELHAILADIRKDDERAGAVIYRMRALLRKRTLEWQPQDINAVVEDVLKLVSSDASLRGISLVTELAPGLPNIFGDLIHLQQVLLNLLLNGMEAAAGQPPERRRISIRSWRAAEDRVELAVIDSGCGIEPDKLPRLFEPFYTTKPNGMGMGLSIARTIIEAHHGRIWAENNPSGGAVFRMALPVAAKTD